MKKRLITTTDEEEEVERDCNKSSQVIFFDKDGKKMEKHVKIGAGGSQREGGGADHLHEGYKEFRSHVKQTSCAKEKNTKKNMKIGGAGHIKRECGGDDWVGWEELIMNQDLYDSVATSPADQSEIDKETRLGILQDRLMELMGRSKFREPISIKSSADARLAKKFYMWRNRVVKGKIAKECNSILADHLKILWKEETREDALGARNLPDYTMLRFNKNEADEVGKKKNIQAEEVEEELVGKSPMETGDFVRKLEELVAGGVMTPEEADTFKSREAQKIVARKDKEAEERRKAREFDPEIEIKGFLRGMDSLVALGNKTKEEVQHLKSTGVEKILKAAAVESEYEAEDDLFRKEKKKEKHKKIERSGSQVSEYEAEDDLFRKEKKKKEKHKKIERSGSQVSEYEAEDDLFRKEKKKE